MYLNHLSLTNFRNFARLDLDIRPGVMMLVGDNAQGKTSLLEAIFYLSSLVSLHAENDRQLINFFAARETLAVARIIAEFAKGNRIHRLEVRIIQEMNGTNGTTKTRKETLLDGVKCKSGDAIGVFNAVLFLPQMLKIVEGSPDERRRFMNLALAQVIPHYAEAFADYSKSITQRNALLKLLYERGGEVSQLDYWDDKISISGAVLIYNRIQAIQEFNRLVAPIHQELTHGQETLRLSYEPSYDPLPQPENQYLLRVDTSIDRSSLSLSEIQSGFLRRLHQSRQEEIARGVTTCGPHRDDLRFISNGIDLGSFGSRGQVRTVLLGLKIAEAFWMNAKTSHYPVLLLDEILAELDIRRREDLLGRLYGVEQIFLTTTDLDLFSSDFARKATKWQVKDGFVKTEEDEL